MLGPWGCDHMLVPIIDGTKGAGKIAARAALVASRPASCLLLTAFRTRDHGNQMLTAARLPLGSDDPWRYSSRGKVLADFTVTKVVAARLLLGFTGRLPDRASFGCALRFVPAPATLDAPAQDFGFVWSPIALEARQ